MAVGRISGPLLAQNLFRDNIPLAFYNTSSVQSPILYLDVQTGRVGVQTASPQYQLDISGTASANFLRASTAATIGNVFISGGVDNGLITTTIGSLTLQPSGNESIFLSAPISVSGVATFSAGVESTSSQLGSVVVQGGVGVTGNVNVYGTSTVAGGTQSYSPYDGQFVVEGGVGISKDLWVGGTLHAVLSTSTVAGLTVNAENIRIGNTSTVGTYYPMMTDSTSGYVQPQVDQQFIFTVNDGKLSTPLLYVSSTAQATTSTTGSMYVAGGATIEGNLFVKTAVDVEQNLNVSGNIYTAGNIHAIGNITAEGNIQLGNNTATDTLLVEAGVASDLIPKEDNKYNVGASTSTWAEGYFNKLYTSIIASQTGTINISPGDNLLQVNANIRVIGDKPIGTAPVVTNILYVTMDGNDTNDGRAEDASRACRTITGAIRSPYYTPGTSIRVAPGRYLEQNPLILLPYTSVLGSDLRTTVIEPINKTQDLFHVQSGCYLFGMQFLNGRSGILPGRYVNGYNRGAYAIAFPPQVGGSKIDTYHSPYVQNCTNQSGPWLMDGTMFQPNQTVQVPLAVAQGSWDANTSTITVNVSTGTITSGMTVNSGPQDPGFFNARTLMLANKPFIQEQVVAYINQDFAGFVYSQAKCFRDVGIIIENIIYDSTFGGNEKSVEAGLAYYDGVVSVIAGQETQTVAAINYINTLAQDIINNNHADDLLSGAGLYHQVINTALVDGGIAGDSIYANLSIITTIINDGPGAAPAIYKSSGPDNAFVSAEILLQANRKFIQDDTLAWITNTYPSFVYNTSTCYRDVGLIVDAVSQDILLGGNTKTVEAAVSYYRGGYDQIINEETTTTEAISHARDISLQIIDNQAVTAQAGNSTSQIINNYFEYGIAAQPAVSRNYDIINTVILNGLSSAPVSHQGGGLFASTGIVGDDVKIPPRVQTVVNNGGGNFTITLDKPTVGFGVNATLYFGDTAVFPALDTDVPDRWQQRRVDPLGAMGGMLVDGSVVSARSPIASMVLNAYTQVAQGGRGIHIINNGYAQLVSIFTIFCNIAVETDSGGIASITNSNSNFGDICLISKGYGKREFSGTVYNPPYPTNVPNGQYYPAGYWPQNGKALIYVPDAANRPHIALLMEVVPPETFINQQGFPGFLTAAPNIATINTGSITITGIDTTDIAIGQTLYIRDQYGRTGDETDYYISGGTIITDVGYQTITLNQEIHHGGGNPTNPNYFTLYTCGNAYYTVLSSSLTQNPTPVSDSLIPGQQGAEQSAVTYLGTLLSYIIDSTVIPLPLYSPAQQVLLPSVQGGDGSRTFITDRTAIIADIAANGVGVAPTITKTGTIPPGAGSAITMIRANINFLVEEIIAFVDDTYPSLTYDRSKCMRDIKLILQQIIYDLETGGNYYSVYSGLSYWSRAGTYHVVELGENLNNPQLMPDGATVNFYQRSYMSASGYTFEYVGAGLNYGSLPQVGRADPVQSKEVVQLDGGKVFFTSTDQNGDFRIGPGLVISQATGVLSGRTFTKSLFANLTPFILAIEAGQ